MKRKIVLAMSLLLLTAGSVRAAEHRIEALDEPAPADALAKPIADTLEPTGYRIIEGESRTVCDVWLCKSWEVQPGFSPSLQVLYPFKQGQLIGAIRYPRSGNDFRDQQIPKGVYTLRYALQPVDGNHVGTSPTRDFLLVVEAGQDKTVEPVDPLELQILSAEAVGSAHPAMLCLQPTDSKPESLPSMQHNESQEWWIASMMGKASAGDQTSDQLLRVIVAGVAME
ncbi:MAG: hypothetical protein WDZ59_15335 [Pirellulales bacterium]